MKSDIAPFFGSVLIMGNCRSGQPQNGQTDGHDFCVHILENLMKSS